MTRKQKKRKKSLPSKAQKTQTDLTNEWIPSATETCEIDVNVPAAQMTRQSIEYINDVPYYLLGVSVRHDLYMIRLMFPKILKNKSVNLWFNPNGVLLPLRELLHTHALPILIGQPSYCRFAGQIQARILKISAAELIAQFWSKVVKANMYKMSKNGNRVLYSGPMFNILTSYYNTVKGDDSNRSWRTVVEDRDRKVEQLTDNECENNEEREDKETLATIVKDIQENDQEDNNTDKEN